MIDEKRLLGRGAPALDQLALAALIESGRFDKHLRHVRGLYTRRRAALVDALAAHAPGRDPFWPGRRLPRCGEPPRRSRRGAGGRRVRRWSVRVYGLSRYRSDGATEPPELLLGFGNLTEAAIRRGVAVLGEVLHAG